MVTMGKEDLKLYTLFYMERLEDGSDQYARFCDIMLTMMGVVKPDGSLADDFAKSEYWDGGNDGTPLRPSARANIKAVLPKDQWYLMEPHEPKA